MIKNEEAAGAITEVCKRDGRVVPFDKNRIAESIFRAARSVGREDRHMANEMAEVVTLFIGKKYDGERPGIDKIQDAVERVLTETGHVETADAFRRYRHERDVKRRSLEVSKEPAKPMLDVPLVDAAGRESIGPWERSRIASALEKEARMDPVMARDIARTVEQKVFSTGIRRLSTSLIRALVENEMFERGLSIHQRRQKLLGVPTFDIERLVVSDPEAAGTRIAETVMRQFTLHAVLSLDISQAHLEGRIHIYGIKDPACASERVRKVSAADLEGGSDHELCRQATDGRPIRFVFDGSGEFQDEVRLPVVTVNLAAAEKRSPPRRSDLCLAIERAVAAAARAQGQRAAFLRRINGSDDTILGPIGFAGLNECASARDENAARLVPWIKKCVGAQYESGVRLILTTESRGSSRFRQPGGTFLSEGLGIPGAPLQRVHALDEFADLFHERVLLVAMGEVADPERFPSLLREAQRLGSVHSVAVC